MDHHGPNPLGVALVLAVAIALELAGITWAFHARIADGANLIGAPALVIAGVALAVRVVYVARRQ